MGVIQNLFVRIKGDATHLGSTLAKTGDTIKSWAGKIAGFIGIAFGLREIVNFTKEATKLAAEAEGVKNAFMKIGDAQGVLEQMKRATRGVIEESDLMALAVKAQNFKIPLQDLSKYLEFATNRAITTGKSVAELTDLIVTGLGRKSSRSMIQLQLSAKDVQEAFKTTGGFMSLVTAELEKMGPVADNAAIRYGALSAAWKDLKEAWGAFVNDSKLIKGAVTGATNIINKNMDENLTFWQKIMMSGKQYAAWKEKFDAQQALAAKIAADKKALFGGGTGSATMEEVETLTTLNAKLAEYKEDLQNADISDTAYLKTLAEKIRLTEEYIKLLQSGKAVPVGSVKTPAKISGKGFSGSVAGEIVAPGLVDLNLKEPIERQFTELEQMFINAGNTLEGLAADMLEGIGAALSGGDVKDIGKNLLMSFANFLSMFGKLLVAYALGSQAFWASLASGGLAWPVALAAGGAMILAAGLIKGALSHASQSVASGGGGSTGSASNVASMQDLKIIVDGKILGKDIYISNRRYSGEVDRHT